jgi:hypothetical protein
MTDLDPTGGTLASGRRDVESCRACESTALSWTRTIPDHEYAVAAYTRYARCTRCASISQVPMPDVSDLTAFYPDTYHSLHGDSRLQRIRNDLRIQRLRALVFRERWGSNILGRWVLGPLFFADIDSGTGNTIATWDSRTIQRMPTRSMSRAGSSSPFW